jgi:hypothetical protein
MDINEFFDVNNKDHLRAYRHVYDTGSWPEGFIPEGTTFRNLWHIELAGRLANEYVKLKLAE